MADLSSNIKKLNTLTDFELDGLKRDIEREIARRENGPTRIIYQVREWGDLRFFTDFRCAALCFSDIAKTILEDAGSEKGKALFDVNKGTLLYGIKPVEITLADFEAKVSQKYFDDICYQDRLKEINSQP